MDELELEFQLDQRLKSDTVRLGEFKLSTLLLMNDAQYPWFILVPRRAGVTELYHLDPADRRQLIEEAAGLAETLSDVFAARKMNVASLGNQVAQLHLHVIARREQDVSWPEPVWGKVPRVPYTDEQIKKMREKLERLLEGDLEYHPV